MIYEGESCGGGTQSPGAVRIKENCKNARFSIEICVNLVYNKLVYMGLGFTQRILSLCAGGTADHGNAG